MKLTNIIYFVVVLIVVMMSVGCGGNSGKSDNANSVTVQMGGAIQGRPLFLSRTVTTFAGSTFGAADGNGTTASFKRPLGVTTDGTNLFVSDSDNCTIRKIVIASGVVTTIAGTAGAFGSMDGMGTSARFYGPAGITTDGTNIYVVDAGNRTIRKLVIATGEVTTFAGTPGIPGSADGLGTAATFKSPEGITTDGTNLYVADSSDCTIRKIVIATRAVTTLAGTAGSTGYSDGIGAAARFASPMGITTDGSNLYVVDFNTIRKVEIVSGAVTTIAGKAEVINTIGFPDGLGADARFNGLWEITTDGTNLYVTEDSNNTVRKIVMATRMVSTVAGTAGNTGSTDGVGSAARFYRPGGITTDGTSLYLADTANNSIRKIL